MQKPTFRTYVLGLLAILTSYIYLTANTTVPQNVIIKEAPTLDTHLEEIRALNYLNELRIGAGLIPLSHNPKLKEAANNHANYLIYNNKIGHYEEEHLKGYTGRYGSERSVYVGYKTPMIIENISNNNLSYKESIDGLMAAIYHRFAFLDFHIDEIGISIQQHATQKDQTAFVYDMGSKSLAELCETTTETKKAHADNTLDNICADRFKSITKEGFYNAIHAHKYQNSYVVTYPYDQQKDIPPAFYEELPDPLPNHSVSGFPISISFNESRIKNIKMLSFKLYDEQKNEVADTLLYDYKSDPNQQLKKFEFALFPLKRLDWDSRYYAKAVYEQDGKLTRKVWEFKTRSFKAPLYTVKDKASRYQIKQGEAAIFYFPPDTQRDVLGDLKYPASFDISFIDKNTIKLIANQKFEGSVYLLLGKHRLNLEME